MQDDPRADGRRARHSLFWRIAALNALIFAGGGVLLILTPATVSRPTALSEVLIVAAGVVFLILLNLAVLRPAVAPLERLAELMGRTDPTRPGERLAVSGPFEVSTVVRSFNAMLDRLEHERRESAGRALRAQEDERRRIAQELHDEIGQGLTAVLLAVSRAAERSTAEARDELRHALEMARASLDDVREIAQRLRPETLDDLGLAPAIVALCRRVARGAELKVERRVDPDLPSLTPEAELVIYRIAQESLTKVVRHSGAGRVAVRLEGDAEGVELSVRDDGAGMNGGPPGGGLQGMRERALLVGGELSIESAPGAGVLVRLRVPSVEEAA